MHSALNFIESHIVSIFVFSTFTLFFGTLYFVSRLIETHWLGLRFIGGTSMSMKAVIEHKNVDDNEHAVSSITVGGVDSFTMNPVTKYFVTVRTEDREEHEIEIRKRMFNRLSEGDTVLLKRTWSRKGDEASDYRITKLI